VKKVPDVLQGSVATRLRCGRIFSGSCYKICCQVSDERILKISQHLGKVTGKNAAENV